MHLGLTPWRASATRNAAMLIEQASYAEDLGYESFWLPENHFNEDAIPDPLMLLASVAGATRRIKLATTSYLLPLRHPLQAAEQVAVLDQLSNGRLILGVGRGVGADMLKAFDVQPHTKRALFESNLELMIKAWSGSVIIGDKTTGGVTLHPLPVQNPHPPIWVAAFGPKALAQAGRLALPYLASPLEAIDDLISNYALHTNACIEANQVPPLIKPVMRVAFASNNKKQVAITRDLLEQNYGSSIWRKNHAGLDDWAIVGSEAFVKQKFIEYQERLSVTHLIVTHLRPTETASNSLDESALQESLSIIASVNANME